MSEIIGRLTDLHKQATEERSHYYVGKCVCDAIATIAELEKRIAAFEAHHEEKDALIIGLSRDAQRNAEDARAERQRREHCEAALRPFAKFANRFGPHAREDGWQLTHSPSRTGELTMGDVRAAAAYFVRYPSESDNRTKVAG